MTGAISLGSCLILAGLVLVGGGCLILAAGLWVKFAAFGIWAQNVTAVFK